MTDQEYTRLRPTHNNTVLVATQNVRIGPVEIPEGALLTPLRKRKGKVLCKNQEDLGGYVFYVFIPKSVLAIQFTTSEALTVSIDYKNVRTRRGLARKRSMKERVKIDSSFPAKAMVRRDGSYLVMNERLLRNKDSKFYIRFWNYYPKRFPGKTRARYVDGVVDIILPDNLRYFSSKDLILRYKRKDYKLPRKYIINLRPWDSGFVEELPDTERIFFNPNTEL